MRAVVLRLLDSPDDISVYDVLMVEFVLQPENKGEPGSMRAEYLKLLYVNEKDRAKRQGARMRKDIPSQFGVAHLHTLQVYSYSCILYPSCFFSTYPTYSVIHDCDFGVRLRCDMQTSWLFVVTQ